MRASLLIPAWQVTLCSHWLLLRAWIAQEVLMSALLPMRCMTRCSQQSCADARGRNACAGLYFLLLMPARHAKEVPRSDSNLHTLRYR